MQITQLAKSLSCLALCGLILGFFGGRVSAQPQPTGRSLKVEKRFLLLPVASQGKPSMLYVIHGDKIVHYANVALARKGEKPLYWAPLNVAELHGETLSVRYVSGSHDKNALDGIAQGDEPRANSNAYHEDRRPQFHFSPQQGWTNDPNGLVWYDGEYHLFFQHNPFGIPWGNMTWGHAVSSNLTHWKEIGDALHPDKFGTMYSGSGIVDTQNTAGFQTGDHPPLVVFYTAAGHHAPGRIPFTQGMAFSNDKGRTWTKYEGNPIVENIADSNRDPKVMWHEPSKQWVMILYVNRGSMNLLGSKDLKEWRELSVIPFADAYECPDLFELAVDEDKSNTRWVVWEGGSRHMIGDFDGTVFVPESGVLNAEHGENYYAAQTWSNEPQGRRIIIGWMRSGREPYEGMPFNQQMSVPRKLTLRTTPEGVRLFVYPVKEIEQLRTNVKSFKDLTLGNDNVLQDISGELFDIEAVIRPDDAKDVTLSIGGTDVVYDADTGELKCGEKSVPIELANGKFKLRVLVDKTSIEIFTNEGRHALAFAVYTGGTDVSLKLTSSGTAHVESLRVWNMNSIW